LKVLGFSGGSRLDIDEHVDPISFHDSAAAILNGGHLMFAVEEERLSRRKHTNSFPHLSIRSCLEFSGIGIDGIDLFATNSSRVHSDRRALLEYVSDSRREQYEARAIIDALFLSCFGQSVADKLHFCEHHRAHAWSALVDSGYQECLIVSLDGDGDDKSGVVMLGSPSGLQELRSYGLGQSLGLLYQTLIQIIGYKRFDEYKVMGLAPYGNPATFRNIFRDCYRLLPQGNYSLDPLQKWFLEFDRIGLLKQARRADSPALQVHRDFAASLQEVLERIVLHILEFYRSETRARRLCLVGGVAQNCSMNGRVFYSRMFDEVFIHPASHDSGGCLGAAYDALFSREGSILPKTLKNVFLGPDLMHPSPVASRLERWANLIEVRPVNDVYEETAKLLASGAVIAWVQGRLEFGPRALGNRSILADPRPIENRIRINAMVKKREEYRPFAPAILENRVREFFECPEGQDQFPFMTIVVRVRDEMRALLGAVTHVDGTARVQTVSEESNSEFYRLLSAFERQTGIPILLNTSFNNHREPIVNSIDDAVTCLLTTTIDYLIVGDHIVSRAITASNLSVLATLSVELPVHMQIQVQSSKARIGRSNSENSAIEARCAGVAEISDRHDARHKSRELSKEVERLLILTTDGSLSDRLRVLDIAPSSHPHILEEIFELWRERYLVLKPINQDQAPSSLLGDVLQ